MFGIDGRKYNSSRRVIFSASSFLVFIVLFLGVSRVWAQTNIQISEPATNETNKEKVSLSFNVVPAMPIEACAVDDRCAVYLYAYPGNGKNYVSDVAVNKRWRASSNQQVVDIKVKDGIVKKNASLIYAQTPEQCVRDEVCVWLAFRETALSAHDGNPYILKTARKIVDPLKWGYGDCGQMSFKHEIETLMQQVALNVPFSVAYENKISAANVLFIATDKMEETVSGYQKNITETRSFESSVAQGSDHILSRGQYQVFSKVAQKGERETLFVIMGDGAEDKVLLPARLMTLFGFRANLSRFPLSVLNNPAEATMPMAFTPLTMLDLLMLRIFYAPEFNEPMSADLARQRFHEVYLRKMSGLIK